MKERVFFEEFDSFYYFHGSSHNWAMQDFHFHNHYEIILFLNDGATLEVGNRSYQAEAGDLFLINNKEYHRTCGSAQQPYSRYVLMFVPELLSSAAHVFGYDFSHFFENRAENFMHKLHLSSENMERITAQMDKIELYLSEREDPAVKVKLKLAILELLVTINEMYEFFVSRIQETVCETDPELSFKEPVLYRERIEQIKKYISSHVGEKLDLDEIAGQFFISRHYLSHYFKKETGFNLAQYITNQKVTAAKALLKQGHSVSEVAVRLSYNTDSHFISVFKRSTGITPKQYAKSKIDKNV